MHHFLTERRKKWQGREEIKELDSNVFEIPSAYDFPGSESSFYTRTPCAALKWVSIVIQTS